MPTVQTMRELVNERLSVVAEELNQRLAAAAEEIAGLFEGTLAEYREELYSNPKDDDQQHKLCSHPQDRDQQHKVCSHPQDDEQQYKLCSHPKDNDQQHKLLDAVLKSADHRADLHQPLVMEEEISSEQQEWNPNVGQEEPEATQFKEKRDEFWTIQDGEQLQQLEEVDITKFPHIFNVRSENDEENPQLLENKEENPPEQGDWSRNVDQEELEPPQIKEEQEEFWTCEEAEHLQQLDEVDFNRFPLILNVKSEPEAENPQSAELRESQPLSSNSAEETETEVEKQDCTEPAKNVDQDSHLQAYCDDAYSDASETEGSSDDQKDPSELQSCLHTMTKYVADDTNVEGCNPALVSGIQKVEATFPHSTQQMTKCVAGDTNAEGSNPFLVSGRQKVEATLPQRTQQIVTDSQCENDHILPRPRRTKSVMMKDACLEDSQLYDSTSVSEDEYVPDTASESEGSDAPVKPKQAKCQSCNHSFKDFSDTAAPDHVTCDSKSITSEVPEAEEPRSSQETIGSVVVGALHKRNGNRVYNKRHYCLFCSKPYGKIARHLERAHRDKLDVAKAISFPKSSKERKRYLDFIRNKGNYAHNAAVMESGKGELIPRKRPHKEVPGNCFMHCAYCQGLFTSKAFCRHMQRCKHKPGSVATKPGPPMPSDFSKQLWQIVGSMNRDPITAIIKNDRVIIEVGQHLLNKGGMSAKSQQFVRERMREMGRLVNNARRVTTLTKMEDFINPENYFETIKAVKVTCGYDSDADVFSVPSLAYKLGNALVKVSRFLKTKGLTSNNQELVRNATEFQEVHREKWNSVVSVTALRNKGKWNVPNRISFTEDIQKMHQFLSQMQRECSTELSQCSSTKAWVDLAKVCLAQIILFNRCREGEVASIPLSAFLSRDLSDPRQDLDWALSEVEKKVCRHFSRIVTRGRQGRLVPVLLTPKMLCALELLVKRREACGVLKDNIYMFARPAAMTHFRRTDCIHGFAKACGAKYPKALVSAELRKHAAALSTVLTMADTDLDQLAIFLGQDIRIHCEFDRLPKETLQLAKIGKVLMALEQGRSAEFRDKNLDQIIMHPDEKVLGSGAEGGCGEEELSGEESLPPTEGDEISPTHKRHKLSSPMDEVPAGKTASKAKVRRRPSEGDGIPKKKRRKLPPAVTEASSGVGAVSRSSKGKALQKRTPWQQAEVQAVERQMNRFISSCVVPAKSDCEKCLRAEPEALKNRKWQNLKFYVYNRITAYKKKMQR